MPLIAAEAAVSDDAPRRRRIAGLVVVLILMVVLAGGLAIWQATRRAEVAAEITLPPPTPVPVVEPVELKQVAPEEARVINAAVPLTVTAVPAAKPFRLVGGNIDMSRATDCLASALYYESANEKTDGQRAVAQVIINRVRHPAFPKTVCGVVYQGSTRTTGCQFSFACDGSMRRIPSAATWSHLRALSREALTGSVYKPVGLATHYHADYVVPYWQSSLDKVRVEGAHLFFRWKGWWGTQPAFRGGYGGHEPQVTKLAALSPAHAQTLDGEVALDAGAPPLGSIGVAAVAGKATYTNPAGDFMIFLVDRYSEPSALAGQALSACNGGPYCKVMMWTDRTTVPTSLPISDAQLSKLAFSYLRNSSNGYEKTLWNCDIFKRSDPSQCMKPRAALAGSAGGAQTSTPVIKDRTAQTAPWANPPSAGLTPVEPDDAAPALGTKAVPPKADLIAPRRRPGSNAE